MNHWILVSQITNIIQYQCILSFAPVLVKAATYQPENIYTRTKQDQRQEPHIITL